MKTLWFLHGNPKGGCPVTTLRKFIVLLAVVVGVLVILALMKLFEDDYKHYPKVYYEYKEKGKSVQFNIDDVRRGFK